MADSRLRSTPCEIDIMKTSDEVNLIDSKPNREIIGRSNICNGCNKIKHLLYSYWVVSRPIKTKFFPFMEHVLRYLKGTINH